MTDRLRIAVLGASGYTGADLVRLALSHPRMEIAALAANAKAGLEIIPVSHVDEVLARALVEPLEPIEWTEADDLASQPGSTASGATASASEVPTAH